MAYWHNSNSDIGDALTRQQQLTATSEQSNHRYFWLNMKTLDPDLAQHKLKQLCQNHPVLATYYAIPDGFDIIRQQQQQPRIDFRFNSEPLISQKNVNDNSLDESNRHESNEKAKIEQEASSTFASQSPHLIVWCWQQKNTVSVLLAGSALTLDDYTSYTIYQALNNIEVPVSLPEMHYSDYSQWIKDLLIDDDAAQAQAYWQSLQLNTLADAKLSQYSLFSPSSMSSSADKTQEKHQSVHIEISAQLQEQANHLANELQVPLSQLLLCVWGALLSKLSNNDELKIQYFHDCRHDYQEFADSLGLFTQPLPIPFYQLDCNDLTNACRGTHTLINDILEYQEYAAFTTSSDHQTGFYWHQQTQLLDMVSNGFVSHCELLLHCILTKQGNAGLTLKFVPNRYNKTAMTQLLQHYVNLLTAAIEQPTQNMQLLDCLLDSEQPQPVVVKTIKQDFITVFEQQVKSTPEQLALRHNDITYTYQELNTLSELYAGVLQHAGAKANTIVALSLSREPEFLICLLGILKSGAAYLPIDPEQPLARRQQIVDDAKPILLISEKLNLTANKTLTLKDLQSFKSTSQNADTPYIRPVINLEQLAYVLYTSGSTGQPKGVQVANRQLMHYSQSVTEQLDMPQNSDYGLISSLVADLGNTMLFPAWLTGSCLHLLTHEQIHDGQALSDYCEQYPLGCLKIVPSHLEALLFGGNKNILPSQVLVLGGEPISSTLLTQLNKLAPTCRLYNHYGPTETTVGVLYGEINLSEKSTSLTHTIGDIQVYLLDKHNQPAISGQCAELYIAGSNVTQGYLNDEKRNAELFVNNTFTNAENSTQNKLPNNTQNTMYRSGDLAIRNANGSINIIGRNDDQVKIRGFRVDLTEIELHISKQNNIAQASVQLQGEGELANIVAFIVLDFGVNIEQKAIDKLLEDALLMVLPSYMIPTQFCLMNNLPLTSNGKIDRKKLLLHAKGAQQHYTIAPRTLLEEQIKNIWQAILQRNEMSIDDDFFALGGHSLAAIKVIAKIRQELNLQLPNDLLFHHKSIEAVAVYISNTSTITTKINATTNPAANTTTSMPKENRLVAFTQTENKPTMILMHAVAGHFNFHQQFIENVSKSYNVYGLKPNAKLLIKSTKDNIVDILDDYIAQLSEFKSIPLVLCGWSLGGKQMVLLAQRMIELGFTIQAIAIIDYDPAQSLTVSNDAKQLFSDFNDYLIAENMTLSSFHLAEIAQELTGNYHQAMQQLIQHPLLKPIIGEELSKQAIEHQFMVRWQLKQLFYAVDVPVVNLPLWVWRGNTHVSPASIWQKYSTYSTDSATPRPILSHEIDADHYSILSHPLLAAQLNAYASNLNLNNVSVKTIENIEKTS